MLHAIIQLNSTSLGVEKNRTLPRGATICILCKLHASKGYFCRTIKVIGIPYIFYKIDEYFENIIKYW